MPNRQNHRWLVKSVLAAFVAAWIGAAGHSLEHSHEEGVTCFSGSNLECGGCNSTDHHHHAPVDPEKTNCRICAAASVGLPSVTSAAEIVLLSLPANIAPEEILPEVQFFEQSRARDPPPV